MSRDVAVAIVTHNGALDLPACLEALALLEPPAAEVVVVDCASQDGSAEVARRWSGKLPLTVVALEENLGFAGGMNQALAHSRSPYVLSLNADAVPEPDFLRRLVERMEAPAACKVGAVAGRLSRPRALGEPPRLDASGMRLRPSWRHLDRGSGEEDRGQLQRPERVFGATGAASLFRREALEDVAVDGDVFDPLFHSFREDAELCFRLRERGWEILYEPAARAVHRRFNLPERRRQMPALVNYHSLKNRYLLRLYHQTGRNLLLTLVPTLLRDLLALGYVLLRERSSLAAYGWLWRHRRDILRRRRSIQSRRTVPSTAVDRWFFTAGEPLEPLASPSTMTPSAPNPRPLKVALLGSRGAPGRYGGYETLVEELAARLVESGFEVTVYCRSHVTPRQLREHRGAELVVLPTLRSKYLDTPVHTFLSCLHAARRGFDAALVVNSANALFVPLLGVAGIPVALHVDGIEKRRAKWGALGRSVYALSERLACLLPDALVTDAEVIHEHYLERYGAESQTIAYGVEPSPPGEEGVLRELGLEARSYFLYVSRFEPENNPHRVAEAYCRVGGALPLVMVGDAPYARDFITSFTCGADPRIIFPGAIYGDGYRELLSYALAYIHATEVGGTHPALVEAMGYGNCVVVNDTPENREVAAEAALYFRAEDPETLARCLERVRTEPELAAGCQEAARSRAAEVYSWERVTRQYADLFRQLAAAGRIAPKDRKIFNSL